MAILVAVGSIRFIIMQYTFASWRLFDSIEATTDFLLVLCIRIFLKGKAGIVCDAILAYSFWDIFTEATLDRTQAPMWEYALDWAIKIITIVRLTWPRRVKKKDRMKLGSMEPRRIDKRLYIKLKRDATVYTK